MKCVFIAVEGDHVFKPVFATEDIIVFAGDNVDRASRRTKLIFVLGKNGSGFSETVTKVKRCK